LGGELEVGAESYIISTWAPQATSPHLEELDSGIHFLSPTPLLRRELLLRKDLLSIDEGKELL
jgi:hypothetical protein